jgi:sulfite exporter TauE/SafE
MGLYATGIVPRPLRGAIHARISGLATRDTASAAPFGPGCLAGGLVGTYLRSPGVGNVFLAGVFTGFLPCGLVYGFLALACSTASLAAGAATMAAFGLGTVPLMVLTGAGTSLVSVVTRVRLLRLAAWCVLLAGVISLARGAVALAAEPSAPAACPLCTPHP